MIYAVNKKTKEHRADVIIKGPDWFTVQADADGWIELTGTECPVPYGCRMQIKTLALNIYFVAGQKQVEDISWRSITHYRPILNSQPDNPVEWNGEGLPPVGQEVSHPTGRGVVMLPPDSQGAIIIKSTNYEYAGEYKRVASNACFPIRTDRERWIEAAMEVVNKEHGMSHVSAAILAMAETIYDAGLAKLPEQTK